ncbi:MAG: hypothetical protein MI976_17975 [Pseudomonadales bacterium]|nr:hypothetical protein [Pseudomonadales bacterium]
MKSKDQLYIDIAKACLAAINQHADTSPQAAYEQVYTAIDAAMEQQFGPMMKAYDRARKALETIMALSEEDLKQARDIAEAALHEQH